MKKRVLRRRDDNAKAIIKRDYDKSENRQIVIKIDAPEWHMEDAIEHCKGMWQEGAGGSRYFEKAKSGKLAPVDIDIDYIVP